MVSRFSYPGSGGLGSFLGLSPQASELDQRFMKPRGDSDVRDRDATPRPNFHPYNVHRQSTEVCQLCRSKRFYA